MVAVQRGLLVLMAAGALALPSHVPIGSDSSGGAPARKAAPAVQYDASQKEAYLTPEQLELFRPGLKFTIVSITDLAPGKKPTVELKMTDDYGNPLDRTGATTPGIVGVRFVVSTWDEAARSYQDVIIVNGNPSRDTTGTFQEIAVGHYKYTFFNTLGNFDVTKPMTVVLSGRRAAQTDVLEKDYWATPVYKDIIPSTGAPATVWAKTVLPKCNACHDPLALHGENYRDIKQCAMCHNPKNMTGNLAEFNGQHFWHAIHSSNSPEIGEVTFPFDKRNCDGCHETKAPQGNVYYTYPNRAACTGCHIDVNFATGQGHSSANLPQADDSQCATCHIPESGSEWDASILGAHTQPAESKQLKGLKTEIVSVENTGPGKKPTVKFKISDSTGKLDPKGFGSNLNLLLGGNTTDYSQFPAFRERADGAAYDAATGVATYTFTNAIPASATGSWTVTIECRRTVALKRADGQPDISYTEGAVNPIRHVAVTGTSVVPRRTVVTLAKCNGCHDRLATLFSHGGQRIAVEECLICHNPNGNDSARRPADGSKNPAESIQMARMIHRIHRGELLTQEYTVYGFGGNPTNFNEVTYPSDGRNCLKCHASAATYDLPLPTGTLNVVTLRDYFTPQGPGTAACLGCHDNRDAAAHAYLNTAPFGEACATCHGAGSDWAVDKVHAR